MYLQGVADFLDDILGGLALIAFSLIVGSLLWRMVVLDQSDETATPPSLIRQSAWGVWIGAIILAAAAGLGLIVKGWIIKEALGKLPFAIYIETVQFRAGAFRFVLSLALAGTAYRMRRAADQELLYKLAIILMLALTVGGAWLVHAVGRYEDRAWVMMLTIFHQFSAGAWIGGVFQLLLLRNLGRSDDSARVFWPVAVTRFAQLGIPAVIVLVATGLALAGNFVGSWAGLIGTAYGSLVLVKAVLLCCALGFALLNNRTARQLRSDNIDRKVPYYIETESLLLVALLFIAVGLSSQPPAVDIPEATASLSEVAAMFRPRMPRLISPSHADFLAGEAGRSAVVDKIPSWANAAWSDYNHNVCGLFLLAMAAVALLSYDRRFRWARYWPLGFIGLGFFLFFRNDPQAWPLGPQGFWESTFGDGEVMQHRITTLSTFAMGTLELRARRENAVSNLSYVFPVLMAVGAIILFAHGHAGFEPKSEYLIRATHNAIGSLAVIMACGRWLELRLAQAGHKKESRIAGVVCCSAMLAVGIILLFYREPLY